MFTSNGSASDHVVFVERANELCHVARLRTGRFGAAAKASLKRASELHDIDPKPGDLSMSRVK